MSASAKRNNCGFIENSLFKLKQLTCKFWRVLMCKMRSNGLHVIKYLKVIHSLSVKYKTFVIISALQLHFYHYCVNYHHDDKCYNLDFVYYK